MAVGQLGYDMISCSGLVTILSGDEERDNPVSPILRAVRAWALHHPSLRRAESNS